MEPYADSEGDAEDLPSAEGIAALHTAGRLVFFGNLGALADKAAFYAALTPFRRSEWVVYAKKPFAGPKAVLAYLSRYTHRVAISNSRLIRLDVDGVSFRWKDYRARGKAPGEAWIKPMTLAADDFIRRFLLHVLPSGFHRIRHYGFLVGPGRAATIDRLRDLIMASDATARPRPDDAATAPEPAATEAAPRICPCCGGRMRIVETFACGAQPRRFKTEPDAIDSS